MNRALKMIWRGRALVWVLGGALAMEFGGGVCRASGEMSEAVDSGVGRASRSWTVTSSAGKQVLQGRYAGTAGFDSANTQKCVLIDLEDGRRRGFLMTQLSEADRLFVRLVETKERVPAVPVNTSVIYKDDWAQYDPVADRDSVSTYATKHFLFYWGHNIGAGASAWKNAAFREMNYQYFERVWDYDQNVLHSPMPYANSAVRYKTNVYITGTGLSKHPEGYAFGDIDITINPTAMQSGSFIVPHEFGHTLQHHTGGYKSDMNNWFWETHAEWQALQFIPSYPEYLEVYAERMQYPLEPTRVSYLTWPYVEYGSWPVLEFMSEDPRFGPKFLWDIWKQARRNAKGDATESPLQTIMRVGVARGVFKGDGVEDFGDLMGEVAAHNATWDYIYQSIYRDALNKKLWESNYSSWERTVLRAVPDRPGWFAPLYSQAPRQYGSDIVDLKREPGATTVTVDLEGIADETEGSDWRATIVAVGKNGKARYSPMWHTGKGSLELQPDDTQLALAIVAAPTTYKAAVLEHQDSRLTYNVTRRATYEVSFEGCTPALAAPHPASYAAAAGAPHANGGGFVASTARVAATAYVGPHARVVGQGQVTGNARIEDYAIVTEHGRVGDNAVVGGHALVRDHAYVGGNARVRDFALVEEWSRVDGNAHVLEYARIHGTGSIEGNAFIKGFGDVTTASTAPMGGTVFLCDNLEVSGEGMTRPINYGLIYGSNDNDELRDHRRDFGALNAHWDFNLARRQFLKDAFADNDGVLRGGATLTRDGSRGVLQLDGDGQYALIEGSAIDCRDIKFDLSLKWNGEGDAPQGASEQHLFGFGGGGDSLEFTPQDETGKAAFVIKRGTQVQVVRAKTSLPHSVWTRLTIKLAGNTAIIYFDGLEVGRSDTMTLNPEDLEATWGSIGTSLSDGKAFNGEIDDFAIYRSAS